MPAIAHVSASIREVPLRHPFVTARDAAPRTVTRPVRIEVTLEDGRVGIGEAVPVQYVTGETQDTVLAAVGEARAVLVGQDALRLGALTQQLAEALPTSHSARAGIEMALHDLGAKLAGCSLWHRFGGVAASVRTDITLSIGADVEERVAEAVAQGFDVIKVKVGPDIDDDIRQLARIATAAPGIRVRIDANQAFAPREALDLIARTQALDIRLEVVEQPVPARDLDALAEVSASSAVPVFADEAVRTPAEAYQVLTRTGVHGINVKLMKSGVSGALDIIALTRAAGRRLMIGCMLETRLGVGFSVAFACGTGAFQHVDLDGHLLVAEERANAFFDEEGPDLRPRG